MTIAESMRGILGKGKVAAIRLGLSMVVAAILVSGCASVISNSEGFYEKIPRRPINWREYLTD